MLIRNGWNNLTRRFINQKKAAVTAPIFLGSNSSVKKLFLILFTFPLFACSPEVGSERWCNNLEEKSKGDWTVNEAKDYAKHCVFR
ncbi:MAG: DUF3012 domain-containing protein [Cellvibrionaceae bacterium]